MSNGPGPPGRDGPARQPAKKRASWVEIFSLPTRCNPARLARQFSDQNGPARLSSSTRFFIFF